MGDGTVGVSDFSAMKRVLGVAWMPPPVLWREQFLADLNGDRIVNVLDFVMLSENFGR